MDSTSSGKCLSLPPAHEHSEGRVREGGTKPWKEKKKKRCNSTIPGKPLCCLADVRWNDWIERIIQ